MARRSRKLSMLMPMMAMTMHMLAHPLHLLTPLPIHLRRSSLVVLVGRVFLDRGAIDHRTVLDEFCA